MKKKLHLLVALFIIYTVACDIVEGPYIETGGNNNGNSVQKVLLEEFTGHQCPNCPGGAAIAKQLHDFYGNKLVIIAYHAGFFARTTTSYPVDYRTAEGNELNTFYSIEYNPVGMINRKSVSSSKLINPVDWGAVVADAITKTPPVSIQIQTSFIDNSRLLSTSIKITALKNLSEGYGVCVYVAEDSLISKQSITSDVNYPDGYIPDYNHMHVFRTSLNGTWGVNVFENGTQSGQAETLLYSHVLNDGRNPDNCHLVVFAYSNDNGEVQQVESKKVK